MRVAECLMAVTILAPAAFQPLTWDDVKTAYDAVRDYTVIYDKQERAIDNGELQRIRLSFRKPLDVKLEWLNEKGKVDQIAVYRRGQNDGKLLAKRVGVLGSVVGTLHLDLRDKRALEDSRHPITEVGIGHIVEQMSLAMVDAQVSVRPPAGDTLDGRPAVRFEIDSPAAARLFGVGGARRAIVWVDVALKLPVKVEIVDAAGTMLERHRFRDVKVNLGLTDQVFTL